MNNWGQRWVIVVCLAFAIIASGPGLFAQTTTATAAGLLADSTGAIIPGARVTVTNTATQVSRSVLTDDNGRFLVAQLPPGPYEISVMAPGMSTLVQGGITLEVGQAINLALKMTPGAVAEQVNVTSEAPQINTTTSSVAGVVDSRTILELPLNGRDFSQLPLVEVGVVASRNTSTSSTMGYGMKISMAGSRPDVTGWLLDGTNIKGITNYGTPASVSGVMMGVDAVQEFQVLVSNYSAEFGGSSGGLVSMVTKSGTNQIHGSAYEYLRNSYLDARNFFDGVKPAFKRNQFGASVGGPIKKDNTFFFLNYEGLVQRQGVTTVSIVPDANTHMGLIPGSGGALQQIQVAPEIQPYLDIWPMPNGPSVGGGLATLYSVNDKPIHENYAIGRIDHQITDRQSIFARFTYDQGTLKGPDALPIAAYTVDTRTRFATLQYQNILTPRLVASTRLSFNRSGLLGNDAPVIPVPASLELFEPNYLPNLSFPGVTTFSPTTTAQLVRIQNNYEVQQSFQYNHGAHAMKFGFDAQQIQYNQYRSAGSNMGNFGWASMQAFLLDSKMQTFTVTAIGADQSEPRSWTQYVYGAYFQDDWKIASRLTLNLGVRYEPFSVPSEKHGRYATLYDWQTATTLLTGSQTQFWKNPSNRNFSPRVGFAWDVNGDGKTAIRAGFGIFFVDLLGTYYGTPGQLNPPFFAQIGTPLGNLATAVADVTKASPTALSAALNPNSNITLDEYNLKPSYEIKYNLSVERQIAGGFSVTAGYVAGRGVHLWRTYSLYYAPSTQLNGRAYVATGTPKINPNAGTGSIHVSDAQSFYNALQLQVRRRYGRNFQLQTSYTWSKNVDDGTSGGVSGVGNDGNSSQPDNSKGDRGLSGLHQGHTLVINGIYNIPSPVKSGVLSYALGGWQLSPIFTANSGEPFSVSISGTNVPNGLPAGGQRPDLVAGRTSANIVTGSVDQYFDPTAFVLAPFGYYGNAGRGILIGPKLFTTDFSLKKSIPMGGERGRLDFRAEVFNVMNRANFALPSSTTVLNASTGAYVAGVGKIIKTVTSGRQLQFSLKYVF